MGNTESLNAAKRRHWTAIISGSVILWISRRIPLLDLQLSTSHSHPHLAIYEISATRHWLHHHPQGYDQTQQEPVLYEALENDISPRLQHQDFSHQPDRTTAGTTDTSNRLDHICPHSSAIPDAPPPIAALTTPPYPSYDAAQGPSRSNLSSFLLLQCT